MEGSVVNSMIFCLKIADDYALVFVTQKKFLSLISDPTRGDDYSVPSFLSLKEN